MSQLMYINRLIIIPRFFQSEMNYASVQMDRKVLRFPALEFRVNYD